MQKVGSSAAKGIVADKASEKEWGAGLNGIVLCLSIQPLLLNLQDLPGDHE